VGILNAGEMDRQISLYHQVVTKNATNGERTITYPSAYAPKIWAKRADMRGTKRLIAQQTVAQQQTEFTIWYRDDMSITDQVIDETGLQYEILQIGQVGRREGLSLLCRAVVS
jgi:SPP1 family predicted phage head-tail adaptor